MRKWLKHWARGGRPLFRFYAKRLTRAGWISGKYRLQATARRDRCGADNCHYSLYVPAGLRTTDQVPLLVMLHGCRQDAHSFAEGTRMNGLASQHRFIVLYPEQSTRSNSLRCWNWFRHETLKGGGEAHLLASLVQRTMSRYPIDPSRVYIAGMSAGGAMAAVLACRWGQLFAACVVVSGVMYRGAQSSVEALVTMRSGSRADPARVAREAVRELTGSSATVPTLVIHGSDDTTVHPRNAEQTIEQLCAFAQCRADAPVVASEEHLVTVAGRSYRSTDYCQNERIVAREIIVDGLEHAWSGGDDRYPFNDAAGPDASVLLWEFVSSFRRVEAVAQQRA